MENVQVISHKDRTVSSTSSTSSITEYVNEVFEHSELELSSVTTVEVNDINYEKKPKDGYHMKAGKNAKVDKNLHDFSDLSSGEQSGLKKFPQSFRKMYVAALVVLLFAVCMGMTATYSATATVDMKKPHSSIHPTEDDVTWIGSLMAIGALVGGPAAGYLTNTLGRKGALVFNTAPFVTGWLLVAYAKSTGLIFAGRVITGFCCGIVSVTTPMYLVEISTPEVRGLLGASFQLFVVIGVLVVAGLGSTLTWRYLAISGAVTSLLAAFLMIPMPESPKWLMAQKRRGEAKNAIKFLQGESFDSEGECRALEEEISKQPKGSVKLQEFKSPMVFKPFMLSVALMFFQQFSGVNAVLFYTVEIFESARSSLDSVLATIIVSVVQVIATLLSSVLMDRAGRKPLLLISGACMALSLFVFGGFDLAKSKNEAIVYTYGWLPLVCLMAFIAAFSIGFGPTPWLMVAEMTPTRFRSFVSGIATAFNWTFVFIITKSFKAMEAGMHDYGVYWLYGSMCVASLFVTYFFLPETKGKNMSEIEQYFCKKNERKL